MACRVILAGLCVCLLGLGAGCRESKTEQESRKRKTRKLESLLETYKPDAVREYIKVTKGLGEGAKVKVYISPSSKDLVIGQLNFGTSVEMIKEYRGWYAVRYYRPDGGEFFGWIKMSQARFAGSVNKRNEVIKVGDENKKRNLTLQESDEELMGVLAVPYKVYQKDADSKPRKRFWGGKEADGHDHIALLSRVNTTSETVQWARRRQAMLAELYGRAHKDYRHIIKAYNDALQWYVADQKGRFTQMLKVAEDKRNEFARHFRGR